MACKGWKGGAINTKYKKCYFVSVSYLFSLHCLIFFRNLVKTQIYNYNHEKQHFLPVLDLSMYVAMLYEID